MTRVVALLLGLALSSVGCTAGPAGPGGPTAESLPSQPTAPAGWQWIGSFGGTTASGWSAVELAVTAGPVAIHAACAGSGDLVVAVGTGQISRSAVVMACGGAGDVGEGRFVLPDPVTAGTETFRAAVIEGAGDFRHPSYEVSIEQPAS